MGLALIIGIGAFVILGIMFVLLHLSADKEERDDPITQEIIIKANNVEVHGPITQEEED